MNKVYVTQSPTMNIDISSAQEYGEIVTLLPSGRIETHGSHHIIDSLAKGLENFDEDKDYLVFIGDTTVMFLVGMILSQMGVIHPKVLKWEWKNKRYETLNLDVTPPAVPFDPFE